jgi:CheY-like chemotaxis protein
MNQAGRPGLRVIALGCFSTELPPLAPRLAQLRVVPRRCADLDQLPTQLGDHDVLLTELAWLASLPPQQREDLTRRTSRAAGWIALSAADARFKDQIDWQHAGVDHFLPSRLDAERLATLIEDIHDRLDGPPLRVILVDDEESVLSYYGEVLRRAGMIVTTTSDPLLVLDIIGEFKPDLLLVDIEMPCCRGPELLTIIRQQPEYAHLPAIFLTAMQGMNDLLLARRAAAEDFLAKPVPPELLLAAVQSQAWRHRARLRADAWQLGQEMRALPPRADADGDRRPRHRQHRRRPRHHHPCQRQVLRTQRLPPRGTARPQPSHGQVRPAFVGVL